MKLLTCILLASVIAAWDPVRPGTLIKKVGDMFIINQSVRIILHFNNVTHIRDNIMIINQGLKTVENKVKEQNINNIRILSKISVIKEKVQILEDSFLQEQNLNREKRAVAMVAAIGALAGLGVANLGLHVDLRRSVNTMEHSLGKLDTLEVTTKDIQDYLTDVTDSIEQLSADSMLVRESLNLFMLLDQLHIKTNELSHDLAELIQDLVLANTGSVSSTLLPISNLIQIINTAKTEWHFEPFFDSSNAAFYYPLLTSYLNGSSVIIDVPFSSELRYNIYKFLPFPMKLNGTVLSVDTDLIDPINYVLSIDNLKESQITNDNLQMCKRTNLDLYLCPSTYFTLNEALGSSCAASLVKNITIFQNCQFKEIDNIAKHETVQDSHYIYFPQRTTVSVLCPNFNAQVASVVGLYSVPDQCELHSDKLTTIANRKQTISLTKEMLLKDIDITLPESSPPMKIRKYNRNPKMLTVPQAGSFWTSYVYLIIPMVIFFILGIAFLFYIYKRVLQTKVIRHISATHTKPL